MGMAQSPGDDERRQQQHPQARDEIGTARPKISTATMRDRIEPSISRRISNYLLLFLGAMTGALGFVLFLTPGNVAPGGVTGLTLIVNRFLPVAVPEGTLLLLLRSEERR